MNYLFRQEHPEIPPNMLAEQGEERVIFVSVPRVTFRRFLRRSQFHLAMATTSPVSINLFPENFK